MPRILLVNPKYPALHPPLGLGYLASYVTKHLGDAVEFRLFDENVDTNLLDIVTRFQPDLVGVTTVTPTFDRAIAIGRLVRTVSRAPLIAGGVHVTVAPEDLLDSPFEVGVLGEGEATFLEIVRNFVQTGRAASERIAGIAFVRDGRLFKTPPRPLIENLDEIPPPARDLFRMSRYARAGRMAHGLYAKGTSLMPSRGCPFGRCDFCSSSLMWSDRVRLFSPRYVAEELESVLTTYDLNFVIFLDDNFTTRRTWLQELCDILEQRGWAGRFRFDCESIGAFMTDARAALLARMGCVRVEFGFESGCPRVLHALKRGKARLDQHERAVEVCRRHGIASLGNMICGYIDETPAELDESARWFLRQPIDYVAAHLYTPYPGTSGWARCVELGRIDPSTTNGRQFQTGAAADNVIVNTEFGPGELQHRFDELNQPFAERARNIIVETGLSRDERAALRRQAVRECGGDLEDPARYRIIGDAVDVARSNIPVAAAEAES